MKRANFVVCIMIALASFAAAQSTISGVVRDTTGASVAGATVEVSSDVLIERVRTATTNGEGRYAIVDLRPGAYIVTVTMQGFRRSSRRLKSPPTSLFL